MNKKLLAAAVAAAVVAAPAAFAQATMYGKMHTSIDSVDVDNGADNKQVNSRASRVGIKGSEDLGNGLKAIYQAEFSVASDGNDGASGQDGGDGWGGQRNTFIGLAGEFGTFLVGRHDTPAKVAFYGAGTEVLGDSAIDLNRNSGILNGTLKNFAEGLGANVTAGTNGKSDKSPIGVFSEFRADNAIAYVSPSFSGFTFAGAIIPGEEGNSGLEEDGLADHWSVGLIYGGNGLKVGAGYQKTEVGGVDQKVKQIGASYTMNNLTVGAHYEDTDNFGQVDGNDYKAWAVTGKMAFGNNAIGVVYTDSELDADSGYLAVPGLESAGVDLDTKGWGVSLEHNFSKRTKAYAAYASDDRDYSGPTDDEDADVFSLGMIHNF